MLVEEIAKAEEDRRPLRERRHAPLAEGAGRSFDGGVDLGRGGEVDGPGLFTRGGIEDGALLAGGPATTWPPIQWLIRFKRPLSPSRVSGW